MNYIFHLFNSCKNEAFGFLLSVKDITNGYRHICYGSKFNIYDVDSYSASLLKEAIIATSYWQVCLVFVFKYILYIGFIKKVGWWLWSIYNFPMGFSASVVFG